jgi:hypothetical protein
VRVLHLAALKRRPVAVVAAAMLLASAVARAEPHVTPDDQKRAEALLTWINANSDGRTGLPHSHVGDERLKNWTFTYDAAVTVLARIAMGDVKRARRILDYYLKTPQAYRLGGVIEAVNTRSAAVGEDYSVRTGSNLWLGIAAYHLFRFTKDARYLKFAKTEADFALSLEINDPKDPNDGAVRLGPAGTDANAGDQHIRFDDRLPSFFDIISTEHNLDAYVLFGMIAREAPPSVHQYRQGQERVLAWLKRAAYNRAEGRFNRGAYKTVDTLVATDVQSWAVSALGPTVLNQIEPGAGEKVLDFVDRRCIVTVPFQRIDGATVTVTGADFIDESGATAAGRGRMVSPEWTFELANAHIRLEGGPNADAHEKRRRELIEGVMTAAVDADGGLALPYATLGDAPVGHDWNTPADGTLSVAGAAWGIMALKAADPIIIPK